MEGIIFVLALVVPFGSVWGDVAVNQYVDGVFRMSLPPEVLRARLDPLAIPNFDDAVGEKLGPVHYSVKTDYSRGNLTGLYGALRAGDCSQVYYQLGNLTFNCSVTFPELATEYEVNIRFGRLPQKRAIALTSFSFPLMFLEVTASRGSNKASLRRLQLVSTGRANVSLDRTGPLPRGRLEKDLGPKLIKKSLESLTAAIFGPYTMAVDAAFKSAFFPLTLWN